MRIKFNNANFIRISKIYTIIELFEAFDAVFSIHYAWICTYLYSVVNEKIKEYTRLRKRQTFCKRWKHSAAARHLFIVQSWRYYTEFPLLHWSLHIAICHCAYAPSAEDRENGTFHRNRKSESKHIIMYNLYIRKEIKRVAFGSETLQKFARLMVCFRKIPIFSLFSQCEFRLIRSYWG